MTEMTFEQWMKAVEVAFTAEYGASIHDLPDCPFRDWFEDGEDPEGAAELCYENAQE